MNMLGYMGLIDKIKNDLSSQLRKCTMFEILVSFIGDIFAAFGWKKIVDENEDKKDNESDF